MREIADLLPEYCVFPNHLYPPNQAKWRIQRSDVAQMTHQNPGLNSEKL
jgi:hypothetical protein